MNTSYVPKNSTLPVLDYIPYHWKEIRSKYLLEERDDRSSDGNEDLLSVSQYTGVTKNGNKYQDRTIPGLPHLKVTNKLIKIIWS